MKNYKRTKIVATLGPATSSPEVIASLITAGVDVFRLNFSHGSKKDHKNNVEIIRAESKRLGRQIGILQDLQGPKIRVMTFENDSIELKNGAKFSLTCDDDSPGNEKRVGISYKNLCSDLKVDDELLLDDGRLALKVVKINGSEIQTVVTLGGELSNHKGINLPGAVLSIPALTDKDIDDLIFGVELDVDWVAISFVRDRDDMLLARHYLARAGSKAKLLAKIEKPGAVERFEEILELSDGVMVARGDLGVELEPELVPIIQKKLIALSIKAGKPVITATQMLESMITNPSPTRAEASDVANAIYDGTDAVMLSAETAIGDYPIKAVEMMTRIILSVEADEEYQRNMREHYPEALGSVSDAISRSACRLVFDLDAKSIVTFTSSGNTAVNVSRNRPAAPILTITPYPRVGRQLKLVWGIIPFIGKELTTTHQMVESAGKALTALNMVEEGSIFIITAGVPFGQRGTTNLIRVERLKS